MTQVPALFDDIEAARTILDSAGTTAVQRMLLLWRSFHPYADKTFITELQRTVGKVGQHPHAGIERDEAFYELQSRWWEMYVGWVLLDQGVELVPRASWDAKWGTAGPDLWAKVNGRRVWIECIAPRPGTGLDRVPEIGVQRDLTEPYSQSDGALESDDLPEIDVPDDLIRLRLLEAIDKKRKQLAGHTSASIVKPVDGYVIAINTRCIGSSAIIDERPPRVARCLYGLGGMVVRFGSRTGLASQPSLLRSPEVKKAKGTPIDANTFGKGIASEVSAVLSAWACPWYPREDPHRVIDIVHNRTARVPLPDGFLPRSTHYTVTVDGKTGTIHRTDPVEGAAAS